MSTDQDKREKLRKIVNDSHTAFMVTRTLNNELRGRPMATAELQKDFEKIWFASRRESGKVDEMKADNHVYLGYTDATGADWASINGTARLVDDRAKVHELWNPYWRNWFTGPDDPELVLIEVSPESAEYWDSGSKAIAMIKFAIAAVTGMHMTEGEHERVDLHN